MHRLRAVAAAVIVAALGLVAVGAGTSHTDRPAVVTVAKRGPIVGTVPMVDVDEQYELQVKEYLDVRFYLDVVVPEQQAVAAYLWAIAQPPPPPPVARAAVSQQAAPNPGTCAGDVECFLACTIGHESASAGVYGAVSPGGTYRGAYQFDASTWRSNAIAAGYGEWANTPVDQVPGAVQDAVAAYLYSIRGNQPWGGRC